MSSMTKPKGPLPARVYWTRRLVALGLAAALVVGVGRLLGAGAQGPGSASARPAGAVGSPSGGLTPGASATPTGVPTRDTSGGTGKKKDDEKDRDTKTPLAIPNGPCDDSDVKVVPTVGAPAYAGHDVTITLNVSTLESPACTWEVSAQSVVVKLTSGTDRIWTTQDCQEAIASQSVVARKRHPATVEVTWSGQRSDDGCTRSTLWAQPGYYHVTGAAFGAEPVDHQFQLLAPVAETITPKPTAKPSRNQT